MVNACVGVQIFKLLIKIRAELYKRFPKNVRITDGSLTNLYKILLSTNPCKTPTTNKVPTLDQFADSFAIYEISRISRTPSFLVFHIRWQ